MKRLTTEEFIQKAKEIHGDKYDYSKVEYVNNKTKVCIVCPEHGEFWLKPNTHLSMHIGCPICNRKIHNTETFINESNKVHNNKYDYSKTEYVDSKTKVCIVCPEHGEFWQKPNNHINGQGCSICLKKVYDTETFIQKAKEIHGDKYDYSKVEYVNNKIKVCIVCPEHGEFWQRPDSHLYMKTGCPKCTEFEGEKTLYNILINEFCNVEYQKHFSWLGRQSLDFYLPDYNVAIEYQGRQHFEPVSIFGGVKNFWKQLTNDLKKYNLCIKNNVKLYYVTFECDIDIEYFTEIYNNSIKLIDKIKNGKN